MSNNQQRQVFLSHVSEDAEFSHDIARGLEDAGISVWYYERDTVPGPAYLIQVGQAIENSAAVVLLISENSLDSVQVTGEVVRAHEGGVPFIPVLVDLSREEFQMRQPLWRQALGGSPVVDVGAGAAETAVPVIVEHLAAIGIVGDPDGPASGGTGEGYVPQRGARERRRSLVLLRRWAAPLGALAVLVATSVIAIAINGGGGDDGDGERPFRQPVHVLPSRSTGDHIVFEVPAFTNNFVSAIILNIPADESTRDAAVQVDELQISVTPIDGERAKETAPPPAPRVRDVIEFAHIDLVGVEIGADIGGIIEFSVSLGAMIDRGVATENISLYRFHRGKWQELSTVLTGATAETALYEAETPGFSLFAVAQSGFPDAELIPAVPTDVSVELAGPLAVSGRLELRRA